MLVRLGNKQNLAKEIHPYFPPHSIYNELFLGAGGMFFNKPVCKYNILNDFDDEVFNFWMVVKNNCSKLVKAFEATPIHEKIFYHWVNNKETDPIQKALRFLMLSNFSYLGKQDCFKIIHSDIGHKKKLFHFIDLASKLLSNAIIRNVDFRDFFHGIIEGDANIPNSKRFVYVDPPYLNTTQNYNVPKWTENDDIDLIDLLRHQDIRFAISNFESEFWNEVAQQNNWQIIPLKKTGKLNRQATEILIINYDLKRGSQAKLF